jgi:hypothetical protein
VRLSVGCITARRPYSRHGLNALKARVKVRELQAIDQRTVAAQALLGWRRELVADLGGEAAVSGQRMALVEAAVRTRLYVDSLTPVSWSTVRWSTPGGGRFIPSSGSASSS